MYSNVADEPQACTATPGYTFYPAPSGVSAYSVLSVASASNAVGWQGLCDVDPSCVGVQVAAGVVTLMVGRGRPQSRAWASLSLAFVPISRHARPSFALSS